MDQDLRSVKTIVHDLNNELMILLQSLDFLARENPGSLEVKMALKATEQCARLTAQL